MDLRATLEQLQSPSNDTHTHTHTHLFFHLYEVLSFKFSECWTNIQEYTHSNSVCSSENVRKCPKQVPSVFLFVFHFHSIIEAPERLHPAQIQFNIHIYTYKRKLPSHLWVVCVSSSTSGRFEGSAQYVSCS